MIGPDGRRWGRSKAMTLERPRRLHSWPRWMIRANQAGNDIYADAPQVQRTIKVIRALQYRGVSSSSGGSAG